MYRRTMGPMLLLLMASSAGWYSSVMAGQAPDGGFLKMLNMRVAAGGLTDLTAKALYSRYIANSRDPAKDYQKYMKAKRRSKGVLAVSKSSSGTSWLYYKTGGEQIPVCQVTMAAIPADKALDQVMHVLAQVYLANGDSPNRKCTFPMRVPSVSTATFAESSAESLLRAAANGNGAGVKLYLDKGVDVNARDKQGWTALHKAVETGNTRVVRLLLAGGADINAKNSSGDTPLLVAAARRRNDMVELLLASGADISQTNNKGQDAVALLLDHYDWVRDGGSAGQLIDSLERSGVRMGRELQRMVARMRGTSGLADREGIIRFATLIGWKEVNEEANRAAVEGMTAFKKATDTAGYAEADAAPWWASPYFNLGVVQEKLRDYSDAKKNFQYYLLAAPDAADAPKVKEKIYELAYRAKRKKEAEEYVNDGAKYYNAGMNARAISAYKQAIEADPDVALAHANLGVCYHKAGRYQDAIVELKEGLSKGAREGYIYDSLGKIYHTLGDRKKAIATLEQGKIDGDGNHGLLSETLCHYYEEDGQYEKALGSCQSTLLFTSEKGIDVEDVNNRIQRLKSRVGR